MVTILAADSDNTTLELLRREFAAPGDRIERAVDSATTIRRLFEEPIDAVVADLRLRGDDGGPSELVPALRERGIHVPVVLVAGFGSIEDAVLAIRSGADDFLSKPLTADQLGLAVRRAIERARLERENDALREALDDRLRLDNFVGTDPRMQSIFKTVKAVAPTRTTVLLTGESGTGKTLLARAIHRASDRRDGPFVEVNCGALPESLLESELFGHLRGSFTGAVKDRAGKFESADGGTIFLDEIGTSSPGLQIKLLRVLQDRVLERVGGSESVPVDVRVVLATNLDLEAAVRAGTFREDLYYRIHVITIEVPPLRERRQDIPLLAEHFLRRFREETGKPLAGFSASAMQTLIHAQWAGNVRQLENVIERAVVLCETAEVGVADLPGDLAHALAQPSTPESLVAPGAHLMPLRQALEGPERLIIQRALEHHGGNRQLTARSLGINRSTLFNKMRKFDLP